MRTTPSTLLFLALACGPKPATLTSEPAAETVSAAAPTPRLADLSIPGDPAFAEVARDVIAARIQLAPTVAAEAGLFEDAVGVPSFAPDAVAALDARLAADLEKLRAMPIADWTLEQRIDHRWVFANAEEARHRLTVERRWRHRPGEWLEPVANTLVAFASYAPDRPELSAAIAARLPAMVDEMRREVVEPTQRDVQTTLGLIDGTVALISALPPDSARDAAIESLTAYGADLAALDGLPEYRVIGAESYAWRLERALMLPWGPDELLTLAERELARVDAEIAELQPKIQPQPPPTSDEQAQAEALDRDGLLALYDDAVAENLTALRSMDVLTVPDDLPAIHARETPPAIIPLSGDGGSMNPPPLFGPPTVGWWNVEHFDASQLLEAKLASVTTARRQATSGFGTYAVHEGVPGHHLQLAMARANPDPLRTLLWDSASAEGWALYAEQLFWEGGGFGDSDRAHANVLRSYRGRIRRVFYDVNVETGRWTLQQASDWRAGTEPGQAEISLDVLRAIQWPTQLIGYFAGKAQIVQMRDEARRTLGEAYSERAFNDAVLAAGPMPMSLVRASVLGVEPPPI